jgi:YVTN family beta-propeller protein
VPELPSGTVTLLFTDVEGSTRLLQQLRDDYSAALAEHDRVLRGAFAAHDGQVVDTQGESFFVAFRRAKEAVAAAVEAQRTLAAHAWPDQVELRVRMGLHTGEPDVEPERYVGLGVHRAARIGAAAHGGQVLLSNATRELVTDDLPPGVQVRDLGSYLLKDFERPERLFQLVLPDAVNAFPPPKASRASEHPLLRRRAVVAAIVTGVLALALALGLLALRDDGAGGSAGGVTGNSLGILDAGSGELLASVPVGTTPTGVAVGEGAGWVTNTSDGTVDRIDLATQTIRQTIRVGQGPSAIVVGAGSIWVTNGLGGTVSRIDPESNEVLRTIDVGNGPDGIAYGLGAVWVVNRDDHTLTKVDPTTGTVQRTFGVGPGPVGVAVAARALWVVSSVDGAVRKIDPQAGTVVETVNVGRGPVAVSGAHDAVWVTNSLDGTVSRIDPATSAVTATIPVGEGPAGVAAGREAVWVANEFGGSLSLIDPAVNDVVRTISVTNRPTGIATDGGAILVAVRAAGDAHRGGTLTFLEVGERYDSIDPALAYRPESWRLLTTTNDGLTAFKRVGGPEGAGLVPNLAQSIPSPAIAGTSYTFRLRPGIRYSTGAEVRPSDVRRALERVFRLRSDGRNLYESLVGAGSCVRKPDRCDLSAGVRDDDRTGTITFRLTQPDPELPAKLALPFAFPVPRGTPRTDAVRQPVPATGPYAIAGYSPGRQIRLVRNPHFAVWSRAARPDGFADEIVIRLGALEEARLRSVARGDADLTNLGRSSNLAALKQRFGSRLRSNPTLVVASTALNTRIAPFDDVRVRRAVNYALDRRAPVSAWGGAEHGAASCQILPPNMPGYRPYCPYERDTAAAQRLVDASGTGGAQVVVWTPDHAAAVMKPVVAALSLLGYRARLEVVDYDTWAGLAGRDDIQATFWGWSADYPSAASWFGTQFSCRAGAANPSRFCDPSVDRLIERAVATQASDPAAAKELWAAIDRTITDQAPYVPMFVARIPDFRSARVGNYQFHPVYTVLLDQLWVR